jgi:CDP-diacylglycerol---glycerol-3-phosphate 3-phosphatidyltransferase
MANLITLFRLASVFVIGAIALYADTLWQFLISPLIIINISLDGLDGIIARKHKEDSVFGALFDIAADRIIEITLWIILAKLNVVSVWIALIYLTRGILVDNLRTPHANQGNMPFSIMKTPMGRFLVGGRTMRFASGLTKLVTFSWLFFITPASTVWPETFVTYNILFSWISNILISTSMTICLARGVPVMLETAFNKKW